MALLQIYDLIQKLLYNIPEQEYDYKAEDDQFIEKFITNYQKITEYILNVESEEIPNLRVDSFSIATKIINVLVKYKILSQKYVYDQFPEFMIEQLKCLDSDMPSLQLITLESLVDIIVSSEAKEEFKQLRNYLEKDDYKIIYKIFRHLWSFLDFHFQEKKIIDFIIIIMQEYPDIYESVINQEFEEHPDTCVLRYSTFFSQTNDFYKRNSKQNQGIGLIPMLTLLEDQNPLIRQSCRSWLTDASSNLFRILDHMIDILIEAHEEAEIKFLESHFYVYTKNYNSKKVIIAMNLLQIVMENLKDIFIQYLFTIKISHKIIERIQEGPYKSKIDLHNCSYLNILMFLLIQFIQGQAQDEQSQEFISQNAIISAKCCEYLEQMLDIAQSIEVSQEILKNSFANILSILRNFINRKDQVMQVQILNLLRTIIIKIKETLAFNKIKKNEYSEQYLALKQQIGSKLFFENLINGLIQAEDHYVKARYINIITIGVHMLSEFLEEQILTENLKLILTKYFDIVKGINLSEEQGDQEEEDQYVYSELRYTRNQLSVGVNVKVENIFKNKDISSLRSKESMTTQLYSKKQQLKQTLYAHGKIKANQYSQENFQEVINIFDSLKAILNYFLKFRETEKNSYISVKENSIVLDIKTQGLLSQDSRTYKDYEPNKSTLRKYSNAVSLILSSLPQILLTYLSVWNLSPNFEKHRLFTDKGIFSYNFDDFKVFNQLLQEDILKLKSQGESDVVKRHVLEVLSPLSQKFSMHFVNAILQTWMIQCTKEFFDEAQYNVTMIKLMEVLITLDITPDAIFTALLSTPVVQSIQQFYTRKYQLKKQTHLYIFDFAQQENNILFFLYTYLSYTSLTVIQKSKLKMIWQEGLKLLQIFRLSMVPQTTFWTQEILLLLSRKFSPSEILEDKSLKKEIHRFCKSQLNLLAIISAQRCSFVTNIDPKNQDLAKQKFKLLTPFTPTIYKCYQNYSNFLKDDEGAENKHDYNIEKIIFSPSGSQQSEDVLNHEEYQIRMSLMSLKTLQNISLHLLQNIYDTNSRVTQIVKDFLVAIMPLIDDRNPQNKYLTESACEFLHSLLTISRDTLINDLKKSVSDIFMKNEFFKCTKLTLRYWTDIINMTIEKGDILADLLQNNNVFTKLFTFSSSEYQKKIKNFERICFIIYSGKKDQYKSQLKILIDSMSVVINDPDAAYEQTALIILILFCIRILILRLSQEVQQDLFRNIWPMILTLLIQIFDKNQQKKKVNYNLQYAALKLIETISIVQMDEFYLHQWIFVFDYFGVIIEPINQLQVNSELDALQNNKQNQQNGKVISPFIFTPPISNSFPGTYSISYISQQYGEDIQQSIKKNKRSILLKDPLVSDENELKLKVMFFCQYMININQQRLEIEENEIESVIEDDFITLDDYIFQLSKQKN
ncbi:hypothetical protein PPERSA_12561 [Pseudocohnilembus persalinus]|uniref:DOP1-like C-terminal domain-containing protein n=1 Tax=Pseudocohnilembus persalinus TaxID=266149 RepID=A0A0V0QCB3_PSEPJ|nr:hypothetical protein PPERSA_12561 [Pseudocohnilembus persalinus]|eukprot:KRW99885.1 hypothetical protein PPERSA_12561 [Pseudocohnilembus persalinus]